MHIMFWALSGDSSPQNKRGVEVCKSRTVKTPISLIPYFEGHKTTTEMTNGN